jgi:BolA family transcriptional regulator, general stress-responsive regulator
MNFIDNVKKKINENIKPENLSVIDNSHLHKKHKFFNVNKFHLKIIIKSKKLKNMHKIKAHKEIYEALKDEMKNRIHALEIEIE